MSKDSLLEKQRRYTQILRDNPRDASAFFKRGDVNSELGFDKAAFEDYSAAISLRPDYTLAYFNRGVLHQRLTEYKEAIADFDMVLALKPDDAQAYVNRGAAYEDLERYELALADYEQAIKLTPTLGCSVNKSRERAPQSRRLRACDSSLRRRPTYRPRVGAGLQPARRVPILTGKP